MRTSPTTRYPRPTRPRAASCCASWPATRCARRSSGTSVSGWHSRTATAPPSSAARRPRRSPSSRPPAPSYSTSAPTWSTADLVGLLPGPRPSPLSRARPGAGALFQRVNYASASNSRLAPPGALEGAVGAVGPVERVGGGHVLVGQREVEDLAVLFDPLAMGGLGDDRDAVLQAPAQ